jgi:hypothetical protein
MAINLEPKPWIIIFRPGGHFSCAAEGLLRGTIVLLNQLSAAHQFLARNREAANRAVWAVWGNSCAHLMTPASSVVELTLRSVTDTTGS